MRESFFQNSFFSSAVLLIILLATSNHYSYANEMKREYSFEEEYLRSITFIVDPDAKGSSSDFYSLSNIAYWI